MKKRNVLSLVLMQFANVRLTTTSMKDRKEQIMTGVELFNNLMSELNRARDIIQDTFPGSDLVSEIDTDLKSMYEYRDSIDALLEDLEIDESARTQDFE